MGSFDAPPKPRSFVVYAAEEQTVAAGKRTILELRFHVVEGVPRELAYAKVGAADSDAACVAASGGDKGG